MFRGDCKRRAQPDPSMKLALFLTSLALPFAAIAGDFPAGSPAFASSFAAATTAAQASGKPVVVVFSASWCPPCQVMKNEVYPSAAVKDFRNRFEWAYLDIDEPENAAIAERFGVNGIPHIQFLNQQGKSLGNQVGSTTPEEFAKRLDKVLRKAGPR